MPPEPSISKLSTFYLSYYIFCPLSIISNIAFQFRIGYFAYRRGSIDDVLLGRDHDVVCIVRGYSVVGTHAISVFFTTVKSAILSLGFYFQSGFFCVLRLMQRRLSPVDFMIIGLRTKLCVGNGPRCTNACFPTFASYLRKTKQWHFEMYFFILGCDCVCTKAS